VGLTVREFEVFLTLASRPDRVVSALRSTRRYGTRRCRTATGPWTYSSARCARRLDDAAPGWTFIHTHFGIGYRFSPEPRVK
jgi:DNA-binding response OmpR family regulator